MILNIPDHSLPSTYVNLPTLACTNNLLKFQLGIAATISVLIILFFFITVTIVTCQVICIQRKKLNLDFHEAVVNRHTDVLQILIERLPDDLSPTIFTKLFEFIERILINSAQDSESTHSISVTSEDIEKNGERSHGYYEREVIMEADGFEMPIISSKSSTLIKTLSKVIQTSMENPKLRPHLDRQMSSLMGGNNRKINRYSSEPLDIGHSEDLSLPVCSAKYS